MATNVCLSCVDLIFIFNLMHMTSLTLHDISDQFITNGKKEVELKHKRYSLTKEWKPIDELNEEKLVMWKADESVPLPDSLKANIQLSPTRNSDNSVRQCVQCFPDYCLWCSGPTCKKPF